jgi:hypothetical protein
MNRSIYNHAECFMRRFNLIISASGTCQNNDVTLYIDSSVIVWTHIAYFMEKVRSVIVLPLAWYTISSVNDTQWWYICLITPNIKSSFCRESICLFLFLHSFNFINRQTVTSILPYLLTYDVHVTSPNRQNNLERTE